MAWYDFPPQQGYPDRGTPYQGPPRNNWDQPTTPMASLGQVMQGTNQQNQKKAMPTYSFPGRAIEAEEEIKAGEIPMDGTLCLFPTKDLSVIYAKAWNAKGTIDTVPYVPKRPDPPQQPNPDPYLQEILNRVVNLETLFQQTWAPTEPAKKEEGRK